MGVNASIIKVCMTKAFVQDHFDLYAGFMQFYAIPQCLNFQEIMLSDCEECGRILDSPFF